MALDRTIGLIVFTWLSLHQKNKKRLKTNKFGYKFKVVLLM